MYVQDCHQFSRKSQVYIPYMRSLYTVHYLHLSTFLLSHNCPRDSLWQPCMDNRVVGIVVSRVRGSGVLYTHTLLGWQVNCCHISSYIIFLMFLLDLTGIDFAILWVRTDFARIDFIESWFCDSWSHRKIPRCPPLPPSPKVPLEMYKIWSFGH